MRHAIRYLTYLVATPLIIALSVFHHPAWALLFLVGAVGMFGTPYKRLPALWRGYSLRDKIRAVLWVPVIRITGDVAKMIGYPVGVWWRFRQRGGRSWREDQEG